MHRRPGTRGALCGATNAGSKSGRLQREEPSFRAHIDFQALKANLPRHIQNVKDRNSSANPQKVVQLYDQWVHLLGEVERLRAERNANAKSMKVREASFHHDHRAFGYVCSALAICRVMQCMLR